MRLICRLLHVTILMITHDVEETIYNYTSGSIRFTTGSG
jgi:ABC-type nitrate/sulfonate/bicarbonate transport system ATPase subunit